MKSPPRDLSKSSDLLHDDLSYDSTTLQELPILDLSCAPVSVHDLLSLFSNLADAPAIASVASGQHWVETDCTAAVETSLQPDTGQMRWAMLVFDVLAVASLQG